MIAIILHYIADYEPGPRVWGPFEDLDVAREYAVEEYGEVFPQTFALGRRYPVVDDEIAAISFETMLVVS